MSSILNDVKHALGLDTADPAFDIDIIMHINTVLAILNQLGVGPALGFMITGPDETWDQLFEDTRLNPVKSYVYYRVRLLFDPPATGFTQAAMERQIDELGFRLNAEVDF
jgi:hypothetical protein